MGAHSLLQGQMPGSGAKANPYFPKTKKNGPVKAVSIHRSSKYIKSSDLNPQAGNLLYQYLIDFFIGFERPPSDMW